MRVLLINVTADHSSTGNIAFAMQEAVEQNNGEALLCYARGKAQRKKGSYKFGLDIETYVHGFLTRITGYTDCFSPFSTWRLIRKIKAFAPDIIHIHALHAYFLQRSMFWKFLQNYPAKILWSIHCDLDFTGRCGTAQDCIHFKNGCGNCPHLSLYPKTYFFDHSAHMWKQKKALYGNLAHMELTTPSKWLAERIGQSFLAHYPLHIVPNGVFLPINTTKTIQKRYSTNLPFVLSVMPKFYDANKGAGFVLELAETMPHLQFIIVSRDHAEEQLAPNVLCLTDVSSTELASLYADASAFVLCSKYESFSLTCAEALCNGTQVVGFCCGAPETLFMAPYANFVEYGNVQALQATLQNTLENSLPKADVKAYGMANFSLQAMQQGYLECYNALLRK